jgi:hypothetical protein
VGPDNHEIELRFWLSREGFGRPFGGWFSLGVWFDPCETVCWMCVLSGGCQVRGLFLLVYLCWSTMFRAREITFSICPQSCARHGFPLDQPQVFKAYIGSKPRRKTAWARIGDLLSRAFVINLANQIEKVWGFDVSAWVPTCKVGLQAGRPSCLFRAFVLNSRVDRCKIELREVVYNVIRDILTKAFDEIFACWLILDMKMILSASRLCFRMWGAHAISKKGYAIFKKFSFLKNENKN